MKTSKSSDTSIVLRFAMWHFLQMLFSYLLINIIITVLFAGALFYSAEDYISKRAASAGDMLLAESAPDSTFFLRLFSGIFPYNTKDAARRLETDNRGGTLLQKANAVKYRVWVPYKNGYRIIGYDMGGNIGLFFAAVRRDFAVRAYFTCNRPRQRLQSNETDACPDCKTCGNGEKHKCFPGGQSSSDARPCGENRFNKRLAP